MNVIFSQIIREHWVLRYKAEHRCKGVPARIIPNDIENMISGYYPQIMYCHVIPTLSHVAEGAEYLLSTNKEVRNIAEWVCKNIVNEIAKDTRITFRVKLRIAVDMLNKLEEKGLDKEICLFYYDNLITNCNDLWYEYAFGEDINTLPF